MRGFMNCYNMGGSLRRLSPSLVSTVKMYKSKVVPHIKAIVKIEKL